MFLLRDLKATEYIQPEKRKPKNDSAQFEQCIQWKELSNESKKNNPKMLIICMQEYKKLFAYRISDFQVV